MNEKNIGKFLRQVEYIRSHLWHSYSVTVNQVMVVHRKTFEVITSTLKSALSKWERSDSLLASCEFFIYM
jgi:hypothetical protein